MDWHYAWTQPTCHGALKSIPQDFYVEEELGFDLDGKGEHLFVLIEKVGVNTDYLAGKLAEVANIDPRKVTYSGVKDRHSCSRQWFCLHVLNADIDLSSLPSLFELPEKVHVIETKRHAKKLKIGLHKSNFFVIRLRNLSGDLNDVEQRLALIKMAGVPNYYGDQRFGIHGNNLVNGKAFLAKGRTSRKKLSKTESFWLSSIRSWCYNHCLSEQIATGQWNQLQEDDIAQENLSDKQFRVKQKTADVLLRQLTMKIHPVLPLISSGWEAGTSAVRAAWIQEALTDYEAEVQGLLAMELSRDSRPTRLTPDNMAWEWVDRDASAPQLMLQFRLPKGAFATSILRELLIVTDCSIEKHNATSDI